jgi:hypothetical protein
MNIDPNASRRFRRTLATIATAASFALSLGATGCLVGSDSDDLNLDDHVKLQCPSTIAEWSPSVSYKVGDLRSFNGAVFQCRTAHTPAPNWDPIGAASLWAPVDCINAPVVTPPTTTPPTTTTPPPDNNGGGGVIGAGGVFDADIKALIDERFFILNVSAVADPARNFTQVTNVGRAGMADLKSLIATGAGKITTSVSGGVEEVVVTVGSERRLQIRRIKSQGFIEGVLVGAATDAKAPFAMTVGNLNGVLTHTLVVDVGNNLKNDLRGTASVNNQVVETGAADSALQLNGGLHAFPEGITIVNDLKFPAIKGF